MICLGCQRDNRADSRFCEACGAPLDVTCRHCGHRNSTDARFCGGCGQPLVADPPSRQPSAASYTPAHLKNDVLKGRAALQGERKPVTVVFCDLVNSTGLAEVLGAEAMHGLLDAFFRRSLAEVHRYEGTINQFLGDGFMALFGAPVAREKHADAAAHAALAILQGLHAERIMLPPDIAAQLTARIGINTGEVVVGSIGDDLRMDFTAVGDTTNTAARLQQAAAPGTILVSESTSRLLRSVRTAPAELLTLRGKSIAVTAHRVIGLRPARSPGDMLAGGPLSPFVGRERELTMLNELLMRAQRGLGQAVGIIAEAGAGKSRLLLEFRRTLVGRRLTYLEADCVSYGSTVPWRAVLEIVRRNSGITDLDTPEQAISKVRFSLGEVGLDPDEWGLPILYVLGLKDSGTSTESLAPEAMKLRIVDTVRRMTLQGSRRRPIVLVVEDCHWIDRMSDECLEALTEILADAAVLLICSYRPGYRPAWLERSFATQVALPRLSDVDSREVLRACVVGGIQERDEETIILRAAGNPLFLEELGRVLQTIGVERGTLPAGVREVILSRIDLLPDDLKRLLQFAAVLGGQFSRTLLSSVWDTAVPLEPLLRGLVRLDFLHEQPTAPESSLAFRHPLVQEVAYETLLHVHRRAMHAAIARTLEQLYVGRPGEVAELLAHHYSRAAEHAQAIEWSVRAGDRAAATYALTEALAFFRQAQSHAERLPATEADAATGRVGLKLANVLILAGALSEARDLLLALAGPVARLGDPVLEGTHQSWLGLVWSLLGDRTRAPHHARHALEAAQACGDVATIGRAQYVLASEHFWLGRLHEAVDHGDHAMAALEQAGDTWWFGLAHWVTGISLGILGNFAAAFDRLARLEVLGRETADRRLSSIAAWSTGILHAFTGAQDAAITRCLEGLNQSPDPLNSAFAEAALGYAYLEAGRADEALGRLERAAEMMTFFGFEAMSAWFGVAAGEASLALGDVRRAQALVERGVEQARVVQFRPAIGWGERARGRLAAARADRNEAETAFTLALQTFTTVGARFEVGRTRLEQGALYASRRDAGAAAPALRDAVEIFTLLDTPIYRDRARRLLLTLNPPGLSGGGPGHAR